MEADLSTQQKLHVSEFRSEFPENEPEPRAFRFNSNPEPPLGEAQTTLGNNTFCGTAVSVQLSKFCEQLLSYKNFTESGP